MAKYDYLDAMTDDILETLEYDYDIETLRQHRDDSDLEDWLNNELFVSSITGNDSGSYTYNEWKAGEYVGQNWDLYLEAAQEFGIEGIPESMEEADVTIRCYLLGQAIDKALKEFDFGEE